MAQTNSPQRRQFQDLFTQIASGWVTASPTAVASAASTTVTITVPGVAADGTWEVISDTNTATNLGSFTITGNVSGANTVTLVLINNSGGSITPTAGAKYVVVCGKLDVRFTA